MEWDELPARVRRFLRAVDGHWVATQAPGRVEVAGPRNVPRRSLRLWLWLTAGNEPQEGRQLRPTCGVPWCCLPAHCGYPKVKRYDKAGGPGRKRRRFGDRLAQAAFAMVLERRGYVRQVRKFGSLRVGEYRLHKRSPVVTWQEPARGWYPRASQMARRIARARAKRAVQSRRAAA